MGAMQTFGYDPNQEITKGKTNVRLVRSDLLKAAVQIVHVGGENNLHSHTGNDGFWYVLRGSASFYDSDDHLFAELGPDEGVLVPRGTPYWFESSGQEPLHILHVAAYVQDGTDRRINHREKAGAGEPQP